MISLLLGGEWIVQEFAIQYIFYILKAFLDTAE